MKRSKVYIIAEIGSNYNRNLDTAKQYITECSLRGADAIKFQSWKSEDIKNTDLATLKKYELPDEWHQELQECCKSHNVDFMSTPFSIAKARLLRSLGVPAIKIASGDLTYYQLLQEVASYNLPVFLSTGMSDFVEIEKALEPFGKYRKNVTLMHCVSANPPELNEANILAIQTMTEKFQLPVGISDHYLHNEGVLAAIALGASVVEKHVTISRQGDTPDSPFALELDEFANMATKIRRLEVILGDGIKRVMPSEKGDLLAARRGLYVNKDIPAGHIIREEDIKIVRPDAGNFKPEDRSRVIGKALCYDIPGNTALLESHIISG
jgi:N,N'-diacetyllegionaminate synthase